MLVEDNPVNARLATLIVEKSGFRAELATNGAEGVAKFRSGNYAGVLMDCHMPVMDGYEATRAIRAMEAEPGWRRAPVLIIAMTANVMQGERERCLAAGMNEYVPKPVQAARLRAVLAPLQPVIPEHEECSAENAAAESRTQGVTNTLRQLTEELGEENVIELLSEWMADFPVQATELRALAGGADQPVMRRAAHSLKGSSALFGLTAMESILGRLEELAARAVIEGQADLAEDVLSEWNESRPVLERLLRGLRIQVSDNR